MAENDRTTGLVGNAAFKVPCRVASTVNVAALSGLLTVDGTVLIADDRVLLTAQTSSVDNGIYVADTGAWERAKDCDGSYDLVKGSNVYVTDGTANSGFWYCTAANPVVVGTSAITWGRASSVLAVVSTLWQAILILTTSTLSFAAIANEAIAFTGDISPTALAANTDNWAPTGFATASTIRMSSSAAYNLTGIAAGTDGRVIMLHNVGAFTITLKDDVTSTAANRFYLAGDYALGADQSVLLEYDATSSRWRLFGQQTGASTIDNSINDFRLTLTTGVPVTTADVTAAGTLYAAPKTGNRIALYDGASWNIRTSAEFSLALVATSGKPYDVFVYDNATVPTLETLVWTNDTTRATALTTQDGVLVKTGDATRRYVGTFYASGANVTEDSFAKRYLWNYYNRVLRPMRALTTTDTWTYTTATIRQANADAANQLDMVVGVNEDRVRARLNTNWNNSGGPGSVSGSIGIGLDSTTVYATGSMFTRNGNVSNGTTEAAATQMEASFCDFVGIGRHYLTWLEYCTAVGTTTWIGDSGAPTLVQSGIQGEIWS